MNVFYYNKSNKQIDGFEKECFFYNELVCEFQTLRMEKGLEALSVPRVFMAAIDKELIIMENLKTQGFTMLDRTGGEGLFIA